MRPAPTAPPINAQPLAGEPWLGRAGPKHDQPRKDATIKGPYRGPPQPSVSATIDYPPDPHPADFGGFVPKAKFMARSLADTHYRCHTPGALCGHEDYVDLIPPIMADKDHDPDSWAARMEQQLKAYFDIAPSEIHVEQIHCGDIGCLIELTQEDDGRTSNEQRVLYEEARASLTDESWFKQQFFASYDDSHFTGDLNGFPVDQNMTEALWIFARRMAASASNP